MLQGIDVKAAIVYAPIREELLEVEKALRRVARVDRPQLAELLEYVLDTPGKRVRPAVTLLSAGFHPGERGPVILMATAVEILHIATLIHDDTVDESDVRRGRTTVSRRWGQKVAVLLGDYLFATSATYVCDTRNVRVIRRFSETIMDLASGELLEYMNSFNWQQSLDDYRDRIFRKTATLFRTAAETGAILSGAPEEWVQALSRYGYNIGMAFQIIDDVLDVQGDPREIGKPVGNDLLQGVVTLPAILLIQRRGEDNPVRRLFEHGCPQEELAEVIHEIQRSGLIEECLQMAHDYCQQALRCLEVLPDLPSKASLTALATYTMERKR